MAAYFPNQVSAVQVGTFFVGQYYNILQQQPSLVHQFYNEASTMMRIDGGASEAATGMMQIHSLIMSLNFTRIEIKTANFLNSWGDGVLVMVSGLVQAREYNARRNFVQTFFLAPQEKGFFILNDMFHFLDEEQIHQPAIVTHNNFENNLTTSTKFSEGGARYVPDRAERHGRHCPSAVNARRLRALELNPSKSSRKVQIRRKKALKSLSKSLSSWLNLLFRNPSSCGCDIVSQQESSGSIGKRQSLDGEREMGVGGRWRSPKRRRDRLWKCGGEEKKGFSSGMVASLKVSLQDVCSFDDLKERMEVYITREGCDEVLLMMYQVCKNIYEGRFKMKANCPLVSDLRLKEKATRILMCYNPE